MPQYNNPTLGVTTTLSAADLILIWQTAAPGNKTITGQNLATALKALMSFSDTVSILTSNTTLDGTYEFVVANSGSGFTITLPLSASFPGKRFRIANKGAGSLTIGRSGGDTIGLATSVSIVQGKAFEFEADGITAWYQLGV